MHADFFQISEYQLYQRHLRTILYQKQKYLAAIFGMNAINKK